MSNIYAANDIYNHGETEGDWLTSKYGATGECWRLNMWIVLQTEKVFLVQNRM